MQNLFTKNTHTHTTHLGCNFLRLLGHLVESDNVGLGAELRGRPQRADSRQQSMRAKYEYELSDNILGIFSMKNRTQFDLLELGLRLRPRRLKRLVRKKPNGS